MSSVLNTSSSALLAFQRALATVSHNVANIKTEGYSRQKVDFATQNPSEKGYGYLGNGTKIADIRRVADQLAISRQLDATGELSRLQQLSGLADRVNTLFSDSATNLAGMWSSFFDATSGLSSNASGATDRRVLLDSANALAGRFGQLSGQLDVLATEVNTGLSAAAEEINRLTKDIATVNVTIGPDATKASPDILDRRDQLISELIGYTGGTAIIQDGGMMNVYTAGGQPLVIGSTASKVTTVTDPYQPQQLQLAIQTQGLTVSLSSNSFGGQVGGLLEFRDTILTPALNELGRMAVGLATQYNQTHRQGMDFYGDMGGDFFTVTPPAALPNASNTGSASLSASYADVSALTAYNVSLRFDGTSWSAARSDNGAAVPLTGAGTAADPLLINGIAIGVSGNAAAGDQFLLQPTTSAASGIAVTILDPSRIAAARPVQGKAEMNNTGNASVAKLSVSDASDANLLALSSIEFIDATQFTIDNQGPHSYTQGQAISANGWSLELDGIPAAGDIFTVAPRSAGNADNGNALQLAAVEDARIFANGTISLNNALSGLTTQVGSSARSADYSLQAQSAIHQSATATRESISGVNLDEEAADMIRLQQAYQAASQLISSADTMFQSILRAASR